MVIFYAASRGESGERLLRIIETVVSRKYIKTYRTIDALSGGLRQPRNDVNIAVFLANGEQDLSELLSIRDLLWDMKIILILPDSDPYTVAKGHVLGPRFLSYCDSDFVDVAAVLSLMIRNLDAEKNIDIHT